jgi:hypothetical protein
LIACTANYMIPKRNLRNEITTHVYHCLAISHTLILIISFTLFRSHVLAVSQAIVHPLFDSITHTHTQQTRSLSPSLSLSLHLALALSPSSLFSSSVIGRSVYNMYRWNISNTQSHKYTISHTHMRSFGNNVTANSFHWIAFAYDRFKLLYRRG